MATNGHNILIFRNDGQTMKLIAGTRSNDIESGSELIEVSSDTDNLWRHYLSGRKEWSLSVSFLMVPDSPQSGNPTDITDLLNIGESYTLSIRTGTPGSNTARLQGTAILKKCKITATTGKLVSGSFQFVGDGELSSATT